MNKTDIILNAISAVINKKIEEIKKSDEYIKEKERLGNFWIDENGLVEEYEQVKKLEAEKRVLENQLHNVKSELEYYDDTFRTAAMNTNPNFWISGHPATVIVSNVSEHLIKRSDYHLQKEIDNLERIKSKSEVILAMALTPKQLKEATQELLESIGASLEDLTK